MKQVGIATMIGGANYGNVLQNFAVQTLIERCGYQALTLDNRTRDGFPGAAKKDLPLWRKLAPVYVAAYRRTQLNNRYGCKNTRDCFGPGLRRAKTRKNDYLDALARRMERFEACRQRVLKRDTVSFDVHRIPREHLAGFTAFVCGSDQVWNPYFHTNSMIEFLQFAPEYKRIALAPSFGVSQLPESRIRDFSEWISAIPRLSVREVAGAKLIRELTGREAQVLLDPTFALTAEDWRSFAREPAQKPSGAYVFCYFLGNLIPRYVSYIRAFARENRCEIVDVCDIHDLRYYDIDPQEFVWLLDHAKAVFTDSFHGTAFSINLERPFVVFPRVEGGASMSSRITTVLEKTGLEQRLFPGLSRSQVLVGSFAQARSILSAERQKTMEFLQTALSAAEAGGKQPILASRQHCTGCGACAAVCPVGAITMTADKEGFRYPVIDRERCIGCGACESACPADAVAPRDAPPEAYYAYARDPDLCQQSSSGGVFSLLAREILLRGGLVFGAGYDEGFRVCHLAVETEADLSRLRTSKYVQSDLGQTFRQVREALRTGKPVLFSGTPCQIAALHRFLGKDEENLYTQDIICHGVPSPGVWDRYLSQQHGGRTPVAVNFRDKTQGWNNFSMKINFADGTCYRELAVKDPFERAFLANLTLRPSCYQCQYKTVSRVSDLTLADYWGVELVHPELKEQQGVSLVLLHSEKGRQLFSAASTRLSFGATDLDQAVSMNHAATHSVAWPSQREEFFAAWAQDAPMGPLVEKLLRPTPGQRLRRFIRRGGSRVKRLLRKVRGNK